MFFSSALAALTISSAVLTVSGQGAMTINTPVNVVQCQPVLLSWSGSGQAPFYLSIIPAGQPSASPLKSFDPMSTDSYSWIADLPSGTKVSLALKDSSGATVYTDAVTILPSSDSGCLNGKSSAAASSGGASSSASVAPVSSSSAASASSMHPSASGPASSAGTTTGASTTKPSVSAANSASSESPKPNSALGLSVSIRECLLAIVVGLAFTFF